MAYCSEKDITRYAEARDFPIIPCNLCGSQEHLQRKVIKEMLRVWDRQSPGRLATIFKAIQNVAPSQLADRGLFDFEGLIAGKRQTESEQRLQPLFDNERVNARSSTR